MVSVSGYPTFVDLLQARSRSHPGREAFSFLADGEVGTLRLSYGELDSRARAIAAHLQGAGSVRERVLLLFPPGLEFVTGFLGCLYAGSVAVPAYPLR